MYNFVKAAEKKENVNKDPEDGQSSEIVNSITEDGQSSHASDGNGSHDFVKPEEKKQNEK